MTFNDILAWLLLWLTVASASFVGTGAALWAARRVLRSNPRNPDSVI